ncbi:acyl-CoA thioesterase [Bordetella avium]|uniref:4-hydroxybenzoyl CoA thioesterase n=1 Tax=Bordetella avium (strain 197N) TaxID=360910 RepID=Q2KUS0_BORA1|nr:thioesterase family protein [Bordetella avium]AZY50363.1 acyl-CoA thioesterase [Bordetella avium]AZY53756.1 acyl-CoA thioesterase [Bordetella avium]RIQ15469.1 acyl-CoA thioesterase [Bordetella avium]RIQ19724.1 acyl-CoA thioesterase [Bordetella avium]RIQ34304.1 acyl-CoA thioesterase [Bordetella avium]
MAGPFVSEVEVRFRHCDPAGIVFYPRYFEMINDFVEEWFEKGLGLSFATLHLERRIGTPTAALQCDFNLPSRWNDRLRQVLELRRIGGASFQAQVRFEGPDGQTRLSARLTIVTVSLDTMRALPLPDDLRARLQDYLLPAQD